MVSCTDKDLHVVVGTPTENNVGFREFFERIEGKSYPRNSYIADMSKDCIDSAGRALPIQVYSMSEFMDTYNNDEIDSSNTFIGYILLEKSEKST